MTKLEKVIKKAEELAATDLPIWSTETREHCQAHLAEFVREIAPGRPHKYTSAGMDRIRELRG